MTVVAMGMFFVGGVRAEDKGVVVELDGLKSTTPAGWTEAKLEAMRVFQFKAPKAEGDDADADISVFSFPPGSSGTLEANLERQVKRFDPASKPEVKVEKLKVGPFEGAYQSTTGTYLLKAGGPFDPNAKVTPKKDYTQLYVIFKGKKGDHYVWIMGPAKTVAKHKKDFEGWLTKFE